MGMWTNLLNESIPKERINGKKIDFTDVSTRNINMRAFFFFFSFTIPSYPFITCHFYSLTDNSITTVRLNHVSSSNNQKMKVQDKQGETKSILLELDKSSHFPV